jgi:hypothetical protein
MPLVAHYGRRVWKGDGYFHRGRAIGLLWEQGVAKAMDIGVGSLAPIHLAYVDLQGGNLKVLEGGQWRKVNCLQIKMTPSDQKMVLVEIKKDFTSWQSWGFLPRWVHQRMPSNLGVHDVHGFFADGGALWHAAGLATLENKFIGVSGHATKLAIIKAEVAERFEALAEVSTTSCQMLSWCKFSGAEVMERGIEVMTQGLPWSPLQGGPSRTKKIKDLVPIFSTMRFFKADDGSLEGEMVATVGSFLTAVGKGRVAKHANHRRKVWLKKVPGLRPDDVAMTTLLIQSGGEAYCSTKHTFAKIDPYL